MSELVGRFEAAVMPTYGSPALGLVSGRGARLVADDGRTYLDLLGGIAVSALGQAHPAVVEAVTAQIATLGHVSNFYATAPAVTLAERLIALVDTGPGRVFFANSGAEANEAAFKLVRRTGRRAVVAAAGGFHGRTMGALSLTGQPAKQEPFAPLVPGVEFVRYGDAAALAAAVGPDTAAVFLEPVQGEAGVIVPPAGYLRAARDVCDATGALLVVDEVQTGVGRTGRWFGFQHEAVRPDVVTLAKGLGGGLPIGACVALGDAAELLGPGQHGSTFGGNPVCCAAALAVLDVVGEQDLVARAAALGEHVAARVAALGHPLLAGERGRGLLRALVLHQPIARAVEAAARQAGFLVNAVVADAVRLAPPLVVEEAELDTFLDALPDILDTAGEAVSVAS